jgi:hypothetical protein
MYVGATFNYSFDQLANYSFISLLDNWTRRWKWLCIGTKVKSSQASQAKSSHKPLGSRSTADQMLLSHVNTYRIPYYDKLIIS